MSTIRSLAAALASAALAGCNAAGPLSTAQSALPPGASYLQPFASGVSPARLYAASYARVGSNVTAYNVIPICRADFEQSAILKGLTSAPTLSYGSVTITDGADVVATFSGLPIGKVLVAGAGASLDQRVTLTLKDAGLIKVDNDGAEAVIAKYVKDRGRGPPLSPRCLDVVESQLKAGRLVIVTKGVLTASSAKVGHDADASAATCGTSSVGSGASVCATLGVGAVVGFSLRAAGGAVVDQTVRGAVYAIIPARLPRRG